MLEPMGSEPNLSIEDQFLGHREAGLQLFAEVDRVHQQWLGVYRQQSDPLSMDPIVTPEDYRWPFDMLTQDQQSRALMLRVKFKSVLSELASSLRDCSVLTEADFKHLAIDAKTIVSAVKFKALRYWESRPICDDNGNTLFVEPPGQEEVDVHSVDGVRIPYLHACERVRELLEYPRPCGNTAKVTEAANSVPAYRPNTAFLMMRIAPDDPKDEDLLERIKEVFGHFRISAVRIDRIGHDGPITDRIIEEIRGSEFLFADLTGERPSVYYEVGYAHALGKRVMLFREKGCKIHFDLANYQCREYKNLADLERQLSERLRGHGLVEK
jgi:hypothetical protein